MSTRANIVLKEGNEKLWFYRHSDGYPEGTLPTLNKFVDWMKSGKIRNNLSQGGGWLIMLGAAEYNSKLTYDQPKGAYESVDTGTIGEPEDWKVGAYEPTTGQHGDIEYLYTVDMDKMTVKVKSV